MITMIKFKRTKGGFIKKLNCPVCGNTRAWVTDVKDGFIREIWCRSCDIKTPVSIRHQEYDH